MILESLPHRPDGLANLRAISLMKWSDIADVLEKCRTESLREGEQEIAIRAAQYLINKGISPTSAGNSDENRIQPDS
jgi:hypothetical protein